MDFATQLDMVSMYADAHSRLIASRFKFNLLLSVNDPHYGQNKFTDALLLPFGTSAIWWFLMMMISRIYTPEITSSSTWSLCGSSLHLILVSIKIEVDVPNSMASSCSTSTILFFVVSFQLFVVRLLMFHFTVFFMFQW